MAKKWGWAVLALLVLAGGGAYWWLAGKTYEIRITQAQIEQQLAQKLPMTKDYRFLYVTLAQPRVHLNEDSDRVDFGLDVTVAINAGAILPPIKTEVDVSGGVRYDAQQGAFFLTDPVVEKLHLQGVDDKRMNAANAALSAVVTAYFREYPVYRLSGLGYQQREARMVLKGVKVERGDLVVVMGM